MKSGIFAGINQIVFHDNTVRTFVGVQAPATVIERINMMYHVVADAGSFGGAKGVNSAHIAQFAPAKMMKMIVGDKVIFRRAVRISPNPADRYCRVTEIGYFVMTYFIVAAVEDNYSHRTGKHISAMMNNVVVHRNITCYLSIGGQRGCADFYSAAA